MCGVPPRARFTRREVSFASAWRICAHLRKNLQMPPPARPSRPGCAASPNTPKRCVIHCCNASVVGTLSSIRPGERVHKAAAAHLHMPQQLGVVR
eukprot:1194611-Prorocentrum_minimum.AAC.11